MANVVDVPKTITGFAHTKNLPKRMKENGCMCGCQRVVGDTGTLREDGDTRKFLGMGTAIYEFPATQYRRETSVAYEVDELEDA